LGDLDFLFLLFIFVGVLRAEERLDEARDERDEVFEVESECNVVVDACGRLEFDWGGNEEDGEGVRQQLMVAGKGRGSLCEVGEDDI
jgi:hypothetical protein